MIPSNEKDNEFEYNFITICRYFEPCKKWGGNFIANRKFTSYFIDEILNDFYSLIIGSIFFTGS
jgi:hypothetical protein